jgi:curved DNA-binding protein CbpA
MSSIDLENVERHAGQADPFTLDIERSGRNHENSLSTDHYELLRVGPHADVDTIERVYRTLADRFHPDNPITGDADTFLRLKEAYETLSNQDNRAKYNVLRQYSRSSAPFGLRGREFFDGVRGGQNRRLALLCLLYRQRTNAHEHPGLTVLDLEQLTGCTREEVTSALWYLCAKNWATLGEFTSYSITAEGFDFVESKLEERLEFRALATTRYYRRVDVDDSDDGPRFTKDTLPLDIEPAITSEGNVSIADHYEIMGLGPQADEEAIERVYRTLSSRFHPDNPSTGDAKTFQRIREAYETLSDPSRRAQYNTLRQRSKYSERFRLRARDFFEGIKGEQLRRLAVLCLLYRQAACEGPGLTVLDLEQLTGCTREELGSPLWYLRQKKWAHFGEFTEYSITAEGFDVVENKLDDRDTGRPQAWPGSEDTRGNQFEYSQNGATPRFLIASGAAPENGTTYRIIKSDQTDTEAGRPSASERPEANAEVARGLIQLEKSFDIAEQETPLDVAEEAPARSPQSTPATTLPVIPRAATAPEIRNLQNAGISATDIFQHLLRLQRAGELSGPAWGEEESGITKPVNRFEVGAEPAVSQRQQTHSPETHSPETHSPKTHSPKTHSKEKSIVMPQSLIDNTVDAPENRSSHNTGISPPAIQTEKAPGESRAATQGAAPNANIGPESRTSDRRAESESEESNRDRPLRGFVRRLFGLGAGTKPGASSHSIYQLTDIKIEQPVPAEKPKERESTNSLVPEETHGNESVSPRESAAEMAVPAVPVQTEETPVPAEQGTQFKDVPVSLKTQNPSTENDQVAPGPADIEAASGPANAPQALPIAPEISNSQVASIIPANITAEEPARSEARSVPVTPTAPEISNPQIAASPMPDEQPAITQEPAAAMLQTNAKAEQPPNEQPAPRNLPIVRITPQSSGVTSMGNSTNAIAEQTGRVAVGAAKRVIFSMGGKGGVGKTSVMTGLAEWFDENQIPVTLLDLDTENKACGSLTHFFSGRVPKINIHTPAGLDAFIDHLGADAAVILADMGAGAGYVAHEWFDTMYPDMSDTGVVFTAVGVVTPDPASVESVLNWSAALQDRVDYVIVENSLAEHADFTYWRDGDQAKEFQERFHPAIVRLDNRLADLENAARNYGATLGQVARRSIGAPELQKASLVMRAQSYRRRMFMEFDKVRALLLP